MKRVFLLVFLHFIFWDMSAQQVQELESVTVTTNRLPMQKWQTGRHITVISAAELAQLPVNSLDELLRYVPGVEVQSRGPFGVQGDITMRGSTFSQVLIVVDGVRINDPLTGHFNSNIPISFAEIERIEILKGPAAAVYGADAVGGVVNIVSKTFAGQFFPDRPSNPNPYGPVYIEGVLETQLSLMVGEYDFRGLEGGTFYNGSKIKAGGGMVVNSAKGPKLPTNIHNWFDVQTYSASAAVPVGDGQIMLRSGFDKREFNAQYFYTRSPFDESVEEITNFWNHLKYSKTDSLSSTTVDMAFRYNEDYFLFNPAFPPANEHTTTLGNIHLNHTRHLSEKLTLGGGLQGYRTAITSNDRGNHQEYHGAGYLISSFRPVPALTVGASLRADWDENYGFEILPQASVAYAFSKMVVRASAGRSIRAADYTERFISTNLAGPLPPGRNYGNPNLKAESAWSAEAGVDRYFGASFKLSATGFYRAGKNFIDYVPTPETAISHTENLTPGASYFYAQNIVEADVAGFEVEARLQKQITRSLSINYLAGYTFLNISTGDSVISSKYITGQARHLFTNTLTLHHKRFAISINGLYKQRQPDVAPVIDAELKPSYTAWNGRLDINLFANYLWLQLQVMNIFDEDYSDILGAQMPGRWITGGIKYNLQH